MDCATVLVPVTRRSALPEILPLLRSALDLPLVAELIVSGALSEADRADLAALGARTLTTASGRGSAIRAAIPKARGDSQDPDPAYRASDYPRLLEPLETTAPKPSTASASVSSAPRATGS